MAQNMGLSTEFRQGSGVYEALCAFATKHAQPHSLRGSKSPAGSADDSSCVTLNLGFGVTDITWEDRTFKLAYQSFGKPHWSGSRCTSVVLSTTEEGLEVKESMERLCQEALKAYETAKPSHLTLYSFDARSSYWKKDHELRKRSLSSLVLPETALSTIAEDAEKFLSKEAKEWYRKHSIPYKRTYCLHGPPGCGKSSLIGAIASQFDLNVCVLSLADPDLKDSGLHRAMQHIPKRSVIVFEDIDAIFNHHREKQETHCLVTFSGLLNALDGVGEPSGTIFFLTTNHLDRLDKALIRPGRVDVQVKLDYATDDQVGRMLTRFYDTATDADRKAFVKAVRSCDGGRRVTGAMLQEHFVQHRLSPLDKAIAEVRLGAAGLPDGAGESMWS